MKYLFLIGVIYFETFPVWIGVSILGLKANSDVHPSANSIFF